MVNVTISSPAGAQLYLQVGGAYILQGTVPLTLSVPQNTTLNLKYTLSGYADTTQTVSVGTSSLNVSAVAMIGIYSVTIGTGGIVILPNPVTAGTPTVLSIPLVNTGTGNFPGGVIGTVAVNGTTYGNINAPSIPAGGTGTATVNITPATSGAYNACVYLT